MYNKKISYDTIFFVSRESGFSWAAMKKKTSSAVIKMVLKVLDCDFQKHKDWTLIYITLVIYTRVEYVLSTLEETQRKKMKVVGRKSP